MASSQYRDEGKIIHVELIRGQFHVRKKRRIRKTAKNIHYTMKRLHRPRLWSPPRYLCLLLRHYIKTEENACHSNFKTNMTTVISWEIIERWVTISKMKLTFVAGIINTDICTKPGTAGYVGQFTNFFVKTPCWNFEFLALKFANEIVFCCRNHQHRLAQTYVQNLVRLVMLANPPIFR